LQGAFPMPPQLVSPSTRATPTGSKASAHHKTKDRLKPFCGLLRSSVLSVLLSFCNISIKALLRLSGLSVKALLQ